MPDSPEIMKLLNSCDFCHDGPKKKTFTNLFQIGRNLCTLFSKANPEDYAILTL